MEQKNQIILMLDPLPAPPQAELTEMPRELHTNLGPDEIVLLRPAADTGRLDRQPALAVVVPITDFHSPPAKVLKTLRTCRVRAHGVPAAAINPKDVHPWTRGSR